MDHFTILTDLMDLEIGESKIFIRTEPNKRTDVITTIQINLCPLPCTDLAIPSMLLLRHIMKDSKTLL